ncbi:hypothetical protein C4577_00660 [Candidatus Parcubacteria bacterium]|nr:MAG: hypothetical protein C4577_00660 [Candidatus Parcubacteria bacterium]
MSERFLNRFIPEKQCVPGLPCTENVTYRASYSYVEYLLWKWKGQNGVVNLNSLQEARVLDLGCGTVENGIKFRGSSTPCFCHITALAGAYTVGVDSQKPLHGEAKWFNFAQADLVDIILNKGLQNIPAIKGKTFDIITAKCLLGDLIDPNILFRLHRLGIDSEDFEQSLLSQTRDLLDLDGIIAINSRCFRQEGSDLIETF